MIFYIMSFKYKRSWGVILWQNNTIIKYQIDIWSPRTSAVGCTYSPRTSAVGCTKWRRSGKWGLSSETKRHWVSVQLNFSKYFFLKWGKNGTLGRRKNAWRAFHKPDFTNIDKINININESYIIFYNIVIRKLIKILL